MLNVNCILLLALLTLNIFHSEIGIIKTKFTLNSTIPSSSRNKKSLEIYSYTCIFSEILKSVFHEYWMNEKLYAFCRLILLTFNAFCKIVKIKSSEFEIPTIWKTFFISSDPQGTILGTIIDFSTLYNQVFIVGVLCKYLITKNEEIPE